MHLIIIIMKACKGGKLMSRKATDRQMQILDFVNRQVAEKGYPPSVREICKEVGLKSTSTVHAHIEKLEKDGLIRKDPAKPRALQVINRNDASRSSSSGIEYNQRETVYIPVLGKVTAGKPILAVENIEDTFPVPLDFVQNSTAYMLRVNGESMIDAGILDNDYVLVRKQDTAVNGEIIVALIGDEATVKVFYKENGHIRLQPRNQFMSPIIVKEGVSVLGKVIGVFRKM